MSAEYIMAGGNEQVILCERGIRTYDDYMRNTLDLAAVPMLKELTHLPVIVDPSHATGIARLVRPMALAAAACGFRTHAPARIRNDAVGAETVAAVLDFDRRPRALAKIVYQLAREFFAVFVLSYAHYPLTRAEEFIDHVGNLLVRAVAGDDIRLGEQTCVLGERLRHAAREHYNGIRMQLSQMAHILPRLAVALGGYGAGVDYVDIRLFARPYTFEAALYQRQLHRLRFILIDLAPESAECDLHIITAAKAALPLSFAVKLYSISPSCASPRG